MTASLAALLLAQTPAPTPPAPDPEMTIYTVTPGIAGFIAFIVLALAGWLLFRSLTRHVRRVDFEGQRRQEAKRAEDDAAAGDGPGR